MLDALTRLTNSNFPILIIQYKRADFDVGQEQEFHWALMILKSKSKLEGPVFQAFDRTYQDERGKTWLSHHKPSASLFKTEKCLGGVQIGTVKAGTMEELETRIKNHAASPKFPEWNCRDYIMEIVNGILRSAGLLRDDLVGSIEQSAFLPDLKEASISTQKSLTAKNEFRPHVKYY